MDHTAKRILEIRHQIDSLTVELAQLTGQVSEDVDAKCRSLLAAGDKVGAVKTYRVAMGACSLKEAVDYVNSLTGFVASNAPKTDFDPREGRQFSPR